MIDTILTLNLLVIEDEALIAMTIEDALTLFGHKVVGVAENVATALSLAREHSVDLALCDVRLANGDSGVEAATRLTELGIPVVYLSGNCPPQAASPLVIGCVSKPFHTASLHASVAAAYDIAKGRTDVEVPQALKLYGRPAP